MKNALIAALLFTACHQTFSQKKVNPALKHQLDSIMVLDQKYREILIDLTLPQKQDSVAKALSMSPLQASTYYGKLQSRIDSLNLVFIENVFKQYGYPGKTLVGSPANESAWTVIQHSDKISQYIPIIKTAAERNELPYYLYAMMLDRHLMYQGKAQIYGTQGTCQVLKSIGKQDCFIWPIKNPAGVNNRREKAGFTTTIEAYAMRFDINYRVVKMSEIK
jgi:hypothetical protein